MCNDHNPFPPLSHLTLPEMDLGRSLFITILILITIAAAIFINYYTLAPASNSTGTLTGNVTISPLCPVEPGTVTPCQLAIQHSLHGQLLFWIWGGAIIVEAVPDPQTGYSIALKPGTYRVDIWHQVLDRSPDLPKTVTIRAEETVRPDISIDTGIR